MTAASWAVFRHLIEKKGMQKGEVRKYLSSFDQSHLDESYLLESNSLFLSHSRENEFFSIHYSWFISFFAHLEDREKNLFLSALREQEREKLVSYLGCSLPSLSLSPIAARYFRSKIVAFLTRDVPDLVPCFLLPPGELNFLLLLTKQQMQELIVFLGLRDLAPEMKHLVERKQLKRIQEALSPRERKMLQQLTAQSESPLFPKLHLDLWDGEEVSLRSILQRRGFNRLGKALFGFHPSLIWHVCHRLDTGRAKMIRRFLTDINHPPLKKVLVRQVVETVEKMRGQA